MGKEIVYCSGCGKSLREEDFQKRRAQTIDHLAWCAECKPLQPKPERSPAKTTTRSIPKVAAPRTARHAARSAPSKALLIGIPAGVGLLLVIAIAVGSAPARPKEDAPPPPPEPRPAPVAVVPRPPTAPSKIPAPVRSPDAVLRDLEALAAAGGDPSAVLLACDEARAVLRGTPHEAALRRIEEAARERARAKSDVAKLDEFLRQIRSVIDGDAKGERREEIRRMFDTALGMAGPRRAEVERMRAQWEETTKPPPPSAKSVFRTDFADGSGKFQQGEAVPGAGVGGSPALSMGPAGVIAWKAFDATVRETTTVRLKLKASAPITRVQIMAWSDKRQENGRYYVDRLEPGDWKAVEFKALQFRMGAANAAPPMALGDDFRSLKIHFEGPADARLLIDDVEVVE